MPFSKAEMQRRYRPRYLGADGKKARIQLCFSLNCGGG